jgi:poly(hydroxyalkanoate) depolymerase family esterase
MATFLQFALNEAMSRLKTADVAGATDAIQRALAGNALTPSDGFSGHGRQSIEIDATPPRRMGDVLLALKAHCARFANPAPTGWEENSPAHCQDRFRSRRFLDASGSLTYKLYVPEDQGGRNPALVVMLHGCTQDPDDFARGTRMNALAEEFGLIVTYPHQPRTANAQGCWNWFDTRHQERGRGEPALLAGMAQALAAEFSIDSERIFVAGLSAGGAMADVLSVTHPDVFAAVGVHSGLPHGAATDVMSAFAAMKGNVKPMARQNRSRSRKIIFHGSADATVAPSNGQMLLEMARSGSPDLQEVTVETLAGGKRTVRTLLGPADGRSVAEHWVIIGGGHAWSGGDRSGTYTDAAGPDASREMIRFFLET